jgi:glycosyltransferase involved in cell wall biosynthesis
MISVIIPVYNASRFVEIAVNSAMIQPEVSKIILIEDGSVDGSLSVCQKLAAHPNSRINLYSHPGNSNQGPGASRNLGLSKVETPFIAFLDADDFYLENRFRGDLSILESDSNIDGVYNAIGVKVYDDSEIERVRDNLTTITHRLSPSSLFDEMSPIGSSGYFSGNGLTVRRSVFEKVGYFDTTLELSQDTHMWMKMAAKLTLVPGLIEKPVAMRGVHGTNRVKNMAKFIYYRPKLFLKFLRWADKNEVHIERKLRIWEKALKYQWDYLNSMGFSKIEKKIYLAWFSVENIWYSPYLIGHLNYLGLYFRR